MANTPPHWFWRTELGYVSRDRRYRPVLHRGLPRTEHEPASDSAKLRPKGARLSCSQVAFQTSGTCGNPTRHSVLDRVLGRRQ